MDKKDLRYRNLELLRKTLKQMRCATKPQLADISGLSVVTVHTLLQKLLQSGEAFEDIEKPSSGGRPAQQYCFNAEKRLALTAYMHEKNGRDTLFVSVENLLGEILAGVEMHPEQITLDLFREVLYPYIANYPQIVVVIVGLPGVEVKGRLAAIDYPALQDKEFCNWLAEALGRPVYFENDINAAIAGYGYALGEKNIMETIVGIYFPQHYPPGAGIFQQGHLYKGRDGMAGEIGWRFNRRLYMAKPENMQEIVARAVLLFLRTWNPHRVVLYHEHLCQAQAEEIAVICREEVPQEFLPEIIVKSDIYGDYANGIRCLAAEHLDGGK